MSTSRSSVGGAYRTMSLLLGRRKRAIGSQTGRTIFRQVPFLLSNPLLSLSLDHSCDLMIFTLQMSSLNVDPGLVASERERLQPSGRSRKRKPKVRVPLFWRYPFLPKTLVFYGCFISFGEKEEQPTQLPLYQREKKKWRFHSPFSAFSSPSLVLFFPFSPLSYAPVISPLRSWSSSSSNRCPTTSTKLKLVAKLNPSENSSQTLIASTSPFSSNSNYDALISHLPQLLEALILLQLTETIFFYLGSQLPFLLLPSQRHIVPFTRPTSRSSITQESTATFQAPSSACTARFQLKSQFKVSTIPSFFFCRLHPFFRSFPRAFLPRFGARTSRRAE